jgi:transcriptional regulator with XRE-family HTH domain
MASEQWFLRELREELELTQEKVAGEAGTTQIRISQLERGGDFDEPSQQERDNIVRALVRRAAVRGLEILLLEKN